MTIDQANAVLDQQTEEMQVLMEKQGETALKRENAREMVSKTAKDVLRLERECEREEARAKEVQDGREAGDTKLDEMCRWWVRLVAVLTGSYQAPI